MPLNNKEELNLIVNPDTKLNIEHSGGDGWTILHGDMLSIVKAFKPGVFDAVITDPPYASGGAKPSEKNRTTNQKYSSIPISNSREIGIASQTPAMPNQTGRMKMQIGRARKESP